MQKIQRAFAGELLCPINSLRNFIGNDKITVELLDEAAEYFNVNTLVPALQLYNKYLLPLELSDTLIPSEIDTLVRQVA
jgi:Zn-dependent peptidase ImmA (M78 family)